MCFLIIYTDIKNNFFKIKIYYFNIFLYTQQYQLFLPTARKLTKIWGSPPGPLWAHLCGWVLKVGLTTVPIGAARPNGSTNMGPIHEVGEPSTRAIVWSLCAVPCRAVYSLFHRWWGCVCFSFLASNNHAF